MTIDDETRTCVARTPMQFLRIGDVSERVGLSKSRIYALVSERLFPAPVRLNPSVSRSASAWLDFEIEDWMAARVAERDKALGNRAAANLPSSSAA